MAHCPIAKVTVKLAESGHLLDYKREIYLWCIRKTVSDIPVLIIMGINVCFIYVMI